MANIINFNKDNQEDKEQLGQQQSQQSPIITSQPTTPQAPNQAQPASSGQFTNIQKYLQANKDAGQQVAKGVSSGMQKALAPQKQQQSEAAGQFRASVEKANQALGQGAQYQQQLQQPVRAAVGIPMAQQQAAQGQPGLMGDIAEGPAMTREQAQQRIQPVTAQQAFDPMSIVSDEQKLKEFTNLRLGGGVDEAQLQQQSQQAQMLAGLLKQRASETLGQAGTAAGRQGLMLQAFNRPAYSQGQQRLDNLFLTGTKGAIGDVRKAARQDVQQAEDIYKQSEAGATQAGDIRTQEQKMQEGLQSAASGLESSYMKNLEALIPQVNKARQAEQQRWQKNLDILRGKEQGTIDQDIFDALQLQAGEQSFGVLEDPDLALKNIANVSAMQAERAQDVAAQQDVDYYNALAKLAKGTLDTSGAFTGPRQDQLSLQGISQLDEAVKARTGEGSLRNLLTQAQQDFADYAKGAIIAGEGSDAGSSGLLGSGGDARAVAQANLANYLLGRSGEAASGVTPELAAVLGGTVGRGSGTIAGLAGGLPIAGAAGQFGGELGTALGSFENALTGASSGSRAAASARARDALIDNLMNTLVGKKYGNYITSSGVKDTSGLIKEQRAADRRMSDLMNRGEIRRAMTGTADTSEHSQASSQATTEASKLIENLNRGTSTAIDPKLLEGNAQLSEIYNKAIKERATRGDVSAGTADSLRAVYRQARLPQLAEQLFQQDISAATPELQAMSARQRDIEQRLAETLGVKSADVPSYYNVDNILKSLTNRFPQGK